MIMFIFDIFVLSFCLDFVMIIKMLMMLVMVIVIVEENKIVVIDKMGEGV